MLREMAQGLLARFTLDLEIYTDKWAESGRRLIRKAYDEARNRDHNQITSEHILLSIARVEEPFFREVMQSLSLEPQAVINALEAKLSQNEYSGRGIKMSESFRMMEKKALKSAREQGRRLIESEDMFIALFKDEQSFPVKLFQQLGIEHQTVIEKIQNHKHSI